VSIGKFVAAMEAMFRRPMKAKTEEDMANDFRRDDVLAMMIAMDSQSATGEGVITNDFIAGLTGKFPDVFLPGWAVVDPWKGKAALQELERAISDLKLTGAKWMPILQAFYPHEHRFYPFWDLCQSLGAPVLIHGGTTALGQGMEGGGGLKLDYARPIPCIDSIAADFPRLTIVIAHPAWPWTEEAIAVLVHNLLDETGKLSRRDVAVLTPEQTIGGILVAPGHAGVIISISNGTLLEWDPESGGPARPLVPPQARGDTLSAMSLALDPSGRWLTATRADDELRIYDLTARISPQVLPLSTRDSKTIAFSPEGTLLAALTSDAKLAVWRFDAHEGKSEPLVTIDAVPTELRPKAKDASLRQAQWIDWIDNDRLAIAGDRSRPLLRSAELGKPPQSTRPR